MQPKTHGSKCLMAANHFMVRFDGLNKTAVEILEVLYKGLVKQKFWA